MAALTWQIVERAADFFTLCRPMGARIDPHLRRNPDPNAAESTLSMGGAQQPFYENLLSTCDPSRR